MKFETQLLHSGAKSHDGEVVTPVFHSTTYQLEEGTPYEEIRYSRLSTTPNHDVLHRRLAEIMSVERALVTGSGMAAISLVLDGLVQQGDSILVASTLYGGTAGLLRQIAADRGVRINTFDAGNPSSWDEIETRDVRLIYAETVANPTMEVTDLEALGNFAKGRELLSVVDNTFASPVLVRPAEFGIDVVVHSATKYLNGHSDVAAGVVGGDHSTMTILARRLVYMGAMLDPGACSLLERGMKTLSVRVERQSSTAMKIAEVLNIRDEVVRVCHPYLGARAEVGRRLLAQGGGMLSLELGESQDVATFFDSLEYFTYAPSLGGVESLVIRPSQSSHAGLNAEERKAMGISDRLVRLSIGLEHVDDLVDDLVRALERSTL